MKTDLTLIEKFELQEIIMGSGDCITLFGNAVLWIEGHWRKGPLNLFMDYDMLQQWLQLEQNLLADLVLTSVSEFLSCDMDEPHIIKCQKFAQEYPLVLSATFILHSMENISSDDDNIEVVADLDYMHDINYPESYIIKEVIIWDLIAPPIWNNMLESLFGKTLQPLKSLYLNYMKINPLMNYGYTYHQALSMLHLNFPYCDHLIDLVKIFEHGAHIETTKLIVLDDEEKPF